MGRARTFDETEALDQATLVFWRLGYDGASISELCEAMEISRPSLYAAFGNKEELFRRALGNYEVGPTADQVEAMALPSARAAVEALLRAAAALQSRPSTPSGCLAVHGTHTRPDDSSSPSKDLTAFRRGGEAALRERLERAQREGDLPSDADPGELAEFFKAVIYGMSVKASDGATFAELEKIIRRAMMAWPDQGPD